ncbi:calcium-binding protein [Methylobacterium oryzihabitans]|nr:calcium-binding protein [Methylobacterium oryzihabitans]
MSAPFVALKQGSEFLVNTITQGEQRNSKIANLTNGGFVISWEDHSGQGGDTNRTNIKGQIYNATGVKIGSEFLVNTTTSEFQLRPEITGLTNGGFVVSWEDSSLQGGDSSSLAIKAQIYDANGTRSGSEFLVNTITPGAQQNSTITGLANGGFVVSWEDQSGVGTDRAFGLKAQIYSSTGTKIGGEFLVNTITQGSQSSPNITGLTNGGFVISWTDNSGQGGDASGLGVKAQIYDPTGTRVGTEFLINTITDGDQRASTIASLTGGGFVVSWEDNNFQRDDPNRGNIKAQVYDASGMKVDGEFLANTITKGLQEKPTVTGLRNGGFVISWTDQSGVLSSTGIQVRAQTFDASGAKIGDEFLVNTIAQGNQSNSGITSLTDGSFVVSWRDSSGQGGDASSGSIKAQIFGVYNEVVGRDGVNDQLVGTAGRDRLTGLSGSDRLDGGVGSDLLIGGLGNDTYVVDDPGDVVTELAGQGFDSVLTSLATYTLADNVESLAYTGPGNFVGTGNDLANLITGGIRSDRLDGGAGADTMVGGIGNETYIVDNAGDVVIEQAGEGIDRVLASTSYTLGDNVETLQFGTSASLAGTGNDIANLLVGNRGANVLDGRGGADTLTGGLGNDTFVFRAGETIGDTVTDFVRGTDTLAFYGFGTDAVLSHGVGSDLYTVTSGDGLTSGSFRLTGVSDLDLSAGAANTDARFFA